MILITMLHFQVLIEAGSASSFELSPRFANQVGGHGHHPSGGSRGSREQVHHDVESELQEAMADLAEESLLDGEFIQSFSKLLTYSRTEWFYLYNKMCV